VTEHFNENAFLNGCMIYFIVNKVPFNKKNDKYILFSIVNQIVYESPVHRLIRAHIVDTY